MKVPTSTYFSVLAALSSLSSAGKAPEISNNPSNVVAVADFPFGGDESILGTMKFFSTNGTVKVHFDVTNLPKGAGPFSYHIHERGIDADGNCESAGKHFNPYSAPADCSLFKDDTFCQVGDLAGKHGLINATCFETSYYDKYLSLNPGSPSYIVGKSVVIHYPDLKKMACTDIKVSSESVHHADLESKRNIKHNKDLIENYIPGWEPETEEERELIEESHKEWLKYNNEGDVHVDHSTALQLEEIQKNQKVQSASTDLTEDALVDSEDEEENDESVASQKGYEEVYPEEPKNLEYDEEELHTTFVNEDDWESSANLLSKSGMLVGVVAIVYGLLF